MSRIQVISQVGLVALGFDEPRLHVDVDMKMSGALSDWLQRRGRVGRAWPAVSGDRDYQEKGFLEWRRDLAAGRNPLYVLACGGGKSWMVCKAAASALNRNKAIGFLTVRRVLVDDISRRLSGFGVPHGVIMPGYADNSHRTKVASVHTLASRGTTLDVDCLFVDEGHLYLSTEFKAVIDRHAHIPRVVLTATPWRADGQGLGRIADSMILGPSTQDLIDRGFLVPTRIFTREMPDRSKLTAGLTGEFPEAEVESIMSRPGIVGNCVKEWLYRANNLPTIVHAVNIAHSKKIVAKFQAAGVNAVHIDANTPDAERRAAFDNMCENSPPKTHSLLLDLAGNCVNFGFPEDDRQWTLEDRDPKEPHPTALSVRRCEKCWFTYRSANPKCPECGNAHVPTVRQIREKAAALVELQREKKERAIEKWRAGADQDYKREKFLTMVAEGQRKNWKPFAAIARYKAIFKEDIPPAWRADAFRKAPTT